MSEAIPGKDQDVKEGIITVLHTVFDPEIPVDIYELGLIYNIELDDNNNATVTMTLTSPACPVAGTLPGEVEHKLRTVEGVNDVKVELVWDPPWTPEKMSEAARLTLNM
jgi:FeS assembly SUF system protein